MVTTEEVQRVYKSTERQFEVENARCARATLQVCTLCTCNTTCTFSTMCACNTRYEIGSQDMK